MTRRALSAAAIIATVLLALFGLGVGPAAAHAALVSGVPSCDLAGHRIVTWTIANDFNLAATIDSATTPAGTTTFTAALPALGQTTATSTLPGTATGLVTLAVHTTWSDEFSNTFSGSTFLPDPCPAPPTTTSTSTTVPVSTTTTVTTLPPPTTSTIPPPETSTSVSTTTSPPPATTTLPPPPPTTASTSTSVPPDSTSTTGPRPPSCNPNIPPCAHTGTATVPLAGTGLILAFTGLALYFGSRYRRTVRGEIRP